MHVVHTCAGLQQHLICVEQCVRISSNLLCLRTGFRCLSVLSRPVVVDKHSSDAASNLGHSSD